MAWHPLGMRATWFAEIEPFPSAVLAHHYPNTPNLGDMTKLGAQVLAGKIAAPDILVGGTPCQAFSVAGMREGLADPRGALTIKYVELADATDYVRAIRMIAEMLDALTPRTANQCRALLIDIFNHAAAKGLCPDNPAASTINRIEKKQRKRHTVEGLKAIREKAPAWLQNAIDLALITDQRRTDILNMRFDGVREGFLYVVQQKTAKASDAAWIRFRVTDELQAVIGRCRDDIVSPYLVHRRPDRKKQKQAQTKDHWTQVEERYLTRSFKEAREAAGCYKGWKGEEMPGFHEVRALSLHLYQKAGKDGQKIAGHASESMTKNYQRDHAEIVWSEAIPDLNISEITG